MTTHVIGSKLQEIAAAPDGKSTPEELKATAKEALGTDSIKQGARDLEERRDFKLMISKIKTWEDFNKFKNTAFANEGRLLIGELQKNSKEIQLTDSRRVDRTKQLEEQKQQELAPNKPMGL